MCSVVIREFIHNPLVITLKVSDSVACGYIKRLFVESCWQTLIVLFNGSTHILNMSTPADVWVFNLKHYLVVILLTKDSTYFVKPHNQNCIRFTSCLHTSFEVSNWILWLFQLPSFLSMLQWCEVVKLFITVLWILELSNIIWISTELFIPVVRVVHPCASKYSS